MESVLDIPNISHVIQQAVAPVFLLTGIGSILGVMTNRLSRIVDRYRFLQEGEQALSENYQLEMQSLTRRAWWVHGSISLCTFSALCICLSIAALFVGAELKLDLSRIVALLFVIAMLALISGLLCFLREIALSTDTIESFERKK
jgi:Na+/melibiose symporter-like transporter